MRAAVRSSDMFDASVVSLQETKSRAVQQKRHESWHTIDALQDGADLVPRQYDGEMQGRLARTMSSSHGSSTASTSRYRNSTALRAWFWVEAATLP